MTKVRIRSAGSSYKAIGRLMRSQQLADQLVPIARPIANAMRRDPNPRYVAGVQMEVRNVGRSRGRAKVRISTTPILGPRVEAKRGTIARALSSAGF